MHKKDESHDDMSSGIHSADITDPFNSKDHMILSNEEIQVQPYMSMKKVVKSN